MLLPKTKEREYRVRLALRMGLPIFALILAFISSVFITTYESLQHTFYIGATLLLAFSIYFIFYLIYRGFDKRITEPISKTFTRDYLYKYLKKDMEKEKVYTLILISIDHLHDINVRYGIKNGDKVLYEVAKYIGKYFEDKEIHNFPMGQIKGGDFVVGLKGEKESYSSMLEIFCLKSSEFKVDDIEVIISGAITDTAFSNDLDYMVENLFEIADDNRNKKITSDRDNINPSDLELYVINSIKSKSVSIMTQDIYEDDGVVIKECFFKLKSPDGRVLHPKNYMKAVNRLGLTVDHDLMILEKSIFNCSADDSISFAIRVSPTSLRNYDFLTKAKEFLEQKPHTKGRVIFLLSETEYYSYTDRYNTILNSLRRLGVKIAIDRLGSLHTSFLYLRDLDIDIVRFDAFYTKDIKNKKHNSIIEGINVMAHSRGVKTWVKMVENQEIKDFAKKTGIDYLQGKELAQLNKIYED